jgi:hypothetical protein
MRYKTLMRKLIPALIISATLSFPASAAAARAVSQGFIGLHLENPISLMNDGVSINDEMARAAANGVETVRFPIYWSDIQPYASMEAVPDSKVSDFTPAADGGAPFKWGQLDSFVLAAASKKILLVPTLMGAPSWAADKNYPTGRGDNPFAKFAADLARRYGVNGDFWASNPGVSPVPITTWQIWNEPNFSYYWPQHKDDPTQQVTVMVGNNPTVKNLPNLYFAPTYVDLLRKSRAALKAVNSGNKVMIASMANSDRATRLPESPTWVDLTYVYRAGGKGSFDIVAANLFTGSPTNLVGYLGWYRAAMKAGGDAKLPVTVTEMAWSGSGGHIPLINQDGTPNKMGSIIVSPSTQASNLTAGFTAFVGAKSKSLINGVYWHTWATGYSDNSDVWDWTGLVKQSGSVITPLPLLTAFKNYAFKVEGTCKRKVLATDCLKK